MYACVVIMRDLSKDVPSIRLVTIKRAAPSLPLISNISKMVRQDGYLRLSRGPVLRPMKDLDPSGAFLTATLTLNIGHFSFVEGKAVCVLVV